MFMKRKRYQSKKKFLEAQKRFHLKCTLFGIVGVVGVVGFIFLMRIESMQITSVIVSETAYANASVLQEKVEAELEGNYLFVIPKTNTVLYPKETIADVVREGNPSFSDVEISRNGLQEVEVAIEEYESFGTFCTTAIHKDAQDEDMLVIGSYASGTRVLAGAKSAISRTVPLEVLYTESPDCFLFNDESFVFATTSADLSETQLLFVNNEMATSSDMLGSTYLPIEHIVAIRDFTKKIEDINLQAESVWTKNGEVYTIETTDRLKIHLEPGATSDELFANLKTLLENNVITEGYYKTIDYIDLRFGNRVFYREVE
jgi:hypothetical protein